MEMATAIVVVAALIFVSVFFKKTVRKVAKQTENWVTAEIAESQADLIRQVMEARQDLLDEFGNDFVTPEEFWREVNKQRKRNSVQSSSQQQ